MTLPTYRTPSAEVFAAYSRESLRVIRLHASMRVKRVP